jgi:hypothetical protein
LTIQNHSYLDPSPHIPKAETAKPHAHAKGHSSTRPFSLSALGQSCTTVLA